MDFFEHQDDARKTTRRLVVLFGLAIVGIIIAIYLPIALLLGVGDHSLDSLDSLNQVPKGLPFDPGPLLRWVQPRLLLGVTIGVGVVVGLGSLVRTLALRTGGPAVAESLGGRLVPPASTEPKERRLLNIVEEMSIASGTPIPAVYVLDGEEGINAFAAGWSLDDAAVAVTDGALEQLSRDELQGVVAHEFSHILNGDMRLNIRLIGLLHGILLIGLIGRGIMRTMAHASRTQRRSKEGASAAVAFLLLGLLLWLVGWIGWFFGQLIKAGVSRQREFLADASAVQFTRNPLGLGGALRHIADSAYGSNLVHPRAEEASHLLFGEPLEVGFFRRALASHPPIEMRIERLGPAAVSARIERDGQAAVVPGGPASALPGGVSGLAGGGSLPVGDGSLPSGGGSVLMSEETFRLDPDLLVQQIGTLDVEHIEAGAGVLAALPERLKTAVESPFGAVATLYALLLDARSEARSQQIDEVFGEFESPVFGEMLALFEHLRTVPASFRLPLADLASLPLRTLPPETLEPVLATLRRLIEADGAVDLFEFALHRILVRRLAATRRRGASGVGGRADASELLPDAAIFLSSLAHVGHRGDDDASRAFLHGAHCLSLGAGLSLLPRSDCDLPKLATSLDRLAQGVPGLRRELMAAASHCVLADREVTLREAELLRVFAADLGCPVPLFLSAPAAP